MKGPVTFLATILLATEAAALCFCPQCVLPSIRSFEAVSTSMLPTLAPGTCVVAERWLPDAPLPPRGALIVFRHPVTDAEHVFRLIGLPGDRVQMRDGRLLLNGTEIPQEPMPDLIHDFSDDPYFHCPSAPTGSQSCVIGQARETLPGGIGYPVLNLTNGMMDNTAELLVPTGHVFVLGDNRDNAADSRLQGHRGGPGMIPLDNIWGVAVTE